MEMQRMLCQASPKADLQVLMKGFSQTIDPKCHFELQKATALDW